MRTKALLLKALQALILTVLFSSPVLAVETDYELDGFNVRNVQKVLGSVVETSEAVLTAGNGVTTECVKQEQRALDRKTVTMKALTAENAALNHVKVNRDSVYLQLDF